MDTAVVAEKVRRVQEVDVQRVAFDPFPAVEQPPKRRYRRGYARLAGVLDRLTGAHLVGDRADAADPRGDVGRLGVLAAAQQCFEEPGRFVEVQPRFGYLAVADDDLEAALTLDTG